VDLLPIVSENAPLSYPLMRGISQICVLIQYDSITKWGLPVSVGSGRCRA
jgi:hypothetical protein